MAQIDMATIEKVNKDKTTIHNKVYTTYSVYEVDGVKYVQIDTYGSADRKKKGKLSQTIQFTKESAAFLMMVFAEAYMKE